MEETGTNIYLPSPWSKKMTQPSSTSSTTTASTAPLTAAAATESECIINVTGNTIEAVQRATTLLKKLLPQKVFYKHTNIQIYNLSFFPCILISIFMLLLLLFHCVRVCIMCVCRSNQCVTCNRY